MNEIKTKINIHEWRNKHEWKQKQTWMKKQTWMQQKQTNELDILWALPPHPNVVSYVGVVMEPLCIVLVNFRKKTNMNEKQTNMNQTNMNRNSYQMEI